MDTDTDMDMDMALDNTNTNIVNDISMGREIDEEINTTDGDAAHAPGIHVHADTDADTSIATGSNIHWSSWCRLCAADDHNYGEAPLSLATKYIPFKDDVPTLPCAVCHECSFTLARFDQYADRCEKVQLMFQALVAEANNLKDKESCLAFRNNYLNIDDDESKLFPICSLKREEGNEVSLKLEENIIRDGKRNQFAQNDNPLQNSVIKSEILSDNDDFYGQYSDDDYLPLANVSESLNNYKVARKKSSKKDKKHKLKKKKTKKKEKSLSLDNDISHNLDIKLEPMSDEENVPNESLETVDLSDLVKNEIKRRKSSLSYLKYECYICNEDCRNWHALCIHFRDVHNSRAKIMCCCGKYLASRVSIGRHWAKHGKADSHNCPTCNKKFPRESELQTHMITHMPREEYPFVCCKCARRFTTQQLLRHHEKKHIPMEERLIHLCEICKSKFASKSSLLMHMKAVHERLKPFVCDQCGKAFTTKGILEEHQVRHSDARPHVCKVCHKSFKTKQRLAIHSDTHNGTVYQCPHCPIQLNSRRTLRMHLFVHDDVCRYQCNFCDKAFKRSKDLKNHSNLHTGMRPYSCPWCSRTFANGSNCRAHKRRMHPNELRVSDAKAAMVHRVINDENIDTKDGNSVSDQPKVIYTTVKRKMNSMSPNREIDMPFSSDLSKDLKPNIDQETKLLSGDLKKGVLSPAKEETSSPTHSNEASMSPLNLNATSKFLNLPSCPKAISITLIQHDKSLTEFPNIAEHYQISTAINRELETNFGGDDYKGQTNERVYNKASHLFANFSNNSTLNSYGNSTAGTALPPPFQYNIQYARDNDD